MNEQINIDAKVNTLYEKVSIVIEQAHSHVATVVKLTEVYTKYIIGQYIVEDEQEGNYRAQYGKKILVNLSEKLTQKFGKGWSVDTLEKSRKFYSVYSISATALRKSPYATILSEDKQSGDNLVSQISATTLRKSNMPYPFSLSWSHYLILMRIENVDERCFYEIECKGQNWNVRQLQRQYSSSLYERLALSRNKDEVMRLAKDGQILEKSSDIIKNPLTLEFLGLEHNSSYSESKLENAIIDKMQQFLLELGKGFLFEARQKRFTFNEDHFYVDLVFYNRLLQCFVLIDLKNDKLTHQDLGQMQMYVNYYNRYIKQDFEKPTIGILLCKKKDDALVELTLPPDSNIYASAYQLYLPDKALLQSKVKEWIEEFEDNQEHKKR